MQLFVRAQSSRLRTKASAGKAYQAFAKILCNGKLEIRGKIYTASSKVPSLII